MSPRTVKRGAAAPGPKRTVARAVRSTPKSKNLPEVHEETEKPEVISISDTEVKEETTVQQIADEKSPERPSETKIEQKSEVNGLLKEEDNIKKTFEVDDKGERLDLEDNDQEYEPEEDTGVEYDEKETDPEYGQAEGDEAVEEGDVVEVEDEGDLVEEEMEEDGGEEEAGEEDAHDGDEEEHEDIVEQEEHHEVVKERRKRKEFEVFVGGLDKDAAEEDLKKVFSVVGEVTEVRLMMNPLTKKNKGFAFLRFATVEQAKQAVSELKNPVINGKQCGVTPSQDSDTLFLGNICKTWTKEALKEKLKHYGVEDYEDLTLVEDSNSEGMNRGFAFLEFASRTDAMEAFKRLQQRDVVFGVDRSAKVSFADSFIEPDDEIMAQVKTVFVDGLPASWDEDRVKENLKKYGEIEKIELARNMPSARRKDFGFVTFDTHDAAVACAEAISNAELGEGDNKVKVRARLSRPHHRARGKHFGRDHKPIRGGSRGSRRSWSYALPPRGLSARGSRGGRSRGLPMSSRGFKRAVGFRERRPFITPVERVRPLPPSARTYDRRAPVPLYPKSSSKRDYVRREELPPRSNKAAAYSARAAFARRSSYRDDYHSRASSYSDVDPRTASRTAGRRAYADEEYGRMIERPPPSYSEGRSRDYVSVSGSKRSYSSLDDDPRYVEPRQSRARVDYRISGSQYGDAYSDRLGRSHIGSYGGSRSTFSGSEPIYENRHGMSYKGSVSSSDVGGMYSSSYGSDYLSRGSDAGGGSYSSRGSDVGGSSYSSLYSSRGMGSSGYLGSSGSGSYY